MFNNKFMYKSNSYYYLNDEVNENELILRDFEGKDWPW